MKSSFAIFAVATALATGLAAREIDAWDTDDDGVLSEAEFREGLQTLGLFDRWDTDDDAALDESEVAEALYRLWDADGDGQLSVDEWDDAVDLWYGEDAVNLSVEEWDADDDGTISPFEFMNALEETAMLERLGLGSEEDLLTEDDFASGLFGIADTDADTFLGEEEDVWFVDFLELLNAPGEAEAQEVAEPADEDVEGFAEMDAPDLLQDGEAFSHLPIPCGDGDAGCEEVAQRFCAALDYEPPLDFLVVAGSLYVIRCGNNF